MEFENLEFEDSEFEDSEFENLEFENSEYRNSELENSEFENFQVCVGTWVCSFVGLWVRETMLGKIMEVEFDYDKENKSRQYE